MATKDRRPMEGFPIWTLPMLLLLLFHTPRCAKAQSSQSSPPSNNYPYGTPSFNPSMAIVIVVLISAFFFLGFFSIYLRQCAGDNSASSATVRGGVGGVRSRRAAARGLDPAVIETFPTLVYSEVKGLKIGKDTLECAVCLSEFDDEETLRLLPRCSHVFHPECIDAWLAAHVTCPVCRSNLAVPDPNAPVVPITVPETPDPDARTGEEPPQPPQEQIPAAAPPDHVAITVEEEAEGDRRPEVIDLARIASLKRAMRSRSTARPLRFPRSHSTGHSLVQPGENCDRFTLRLPEHVRREIIAAGKLQRTTSCVSFPTEASTRRGYRGGGGGGGAEGSSRGGRSIRLGRSDRWPSFFSRTFSARVPAWAAWRKGGEGEGSFKKREEDWSNKGRFPSVRAPFECLGGGGGGAKDGGAAGDDESSTMPLARV